MHSCVHLSILPKLIGSDTFCILLLGSNNEQFRMEIGLIRRRLVMCVLEYWGLGQSALKTEGEESSLTSLPSKSTTFLPCSPFSSLFITNSIQLQRARGRTESCPCPRGLQLFHYAKVSSVKLQKSPSSITMFKRQKFKVFSETRGSTLTVTPL